MNDYKELIADLISASERNSNSLNTRSTCKKAADAIEQLVKERDVLEFQNHLERCEHEHTKKERDAAVADFTIYVKHMEDGRKAFSCEFCNEENCDSCKRCSNFEWRGVGGQR